MDDPLATHALNSDDTLAEIDLRLARMLARAYELAGSHLEGINEAALELADLAGDDGRAATVMILASGPFSSSIQRTPRGRARTLSLRVGDESGALERRVPNAGG